MKPRQKLRLREYDRLMEQPPYLVPKYVRIYYEQA